MAWTIEFAPHVEKALRKLGHAEVRRIMAFLRDRVAGSPDPRRFGRPLKGHLSEFWRYRVGDYRVICELRDETLVVLVVGIAHRRQVYR
ncbi:type II toxin-antitoxin system RelE family toxin [Thioalkalivibrio thiocyanodenitrificans]|uniref:type II toxin-antitoxin system RelE family toxin n=1 Tax=Thioalkalivibrio thiocyanodenitrificans TaxID=243063 RepID=UPI000475FA97|nr:type II toxin-antitoxin system RelE/ParE family toxin [Thioalkalivibrio thiocyanodenitrificans]